jgi:hypothetical protein
MRLLTSLWDFRVVCLNAPNSGDIYFNNPETSKNYDIGHFQNIEKIIVTGAGKLDFYGSYYSGKGIDITGTKGNDAFYSYGANDTLRGGGGNDDFHITGGTDTIFSEKQDSDRFYFEATSPVDATITGFNGAGAYGGDRIYFDNGYASGINTDVNEVNGKTEFTITTTGYYENYVTTVTVDQVGLEEGVDYFFV